MELQIERVGRSQFLVYQMQPDEELDEIGLGMIENNKISGILPITQNHIDEESKLSFNITSQVSLEQLVRGMVSRKKILTVFISICDTFLEAENYMLEDDFFLMEKKYIYTDPSNGRANLVYFPVLREAEPINLRYFFRDLIHSIQSNPNENCDYVEKVVSFLDSEESFDLRKFRELVYDLRLNEGRLNGPTGYGSSEFSPMGGGSGFGYGTNAQNGGGGQPYNMGQQDPDDPYSSIGGGSDINYEYPSNNSDDQYEYETEPVKKKSLFGGLFKGKKKEKKEKKPAKEKKSIFGRKKEPEYEEEMSSLGFEVPGQDNYPGGGGNIGFEVPPAGGDAGRYQAPFDDQQRVVKQPWGTGKQKRAVNQILDTDFAGGGSPDDEGGGYTIMGEENKRGEEVIPAGPIEELPYVPPEVPPAFRHSAILTRVSTGERKEVAGNMIRIGRQRDAVDFMITGNKSVSHTHASIVRGADGNYYLYDLQSKNHSYLNGERLVSGRDYLLHNNDRIRLANEEFVFTE